MARGDGSGGVQLRLRPVRGALLTKQEEQNMDDDARLRHAIRISMRDVGGAPASAADAKGSEGAGGSQAAADGSRATVAANGGAGGGRRDNDAAQLPAAAKQEANDATIEEDLAERTQPPCGVSKHVDQGEGGGDAPTSPPGGGSAAVASPAAAPRTTPSRARQTPARYRLEWDSDFVSPAPRKEGKKRTAAAAAGKDAARSPRPQKRKPTLGLSNAKDSRVLKLGSALIGHTVEVYWPKEKQWYEGVICGYNAVTTKHLIEYYDGDSQLEDLSTEEFNFLPPMPMPPSNLKGDIPHPPVDDMGSENLCAHCMKADVDDDESGTTMLCCESCPLVFHMECLEPPLTEAPAGVWLCPLCEAARALLEKGKQARALRAANQPMLEAVPPANPDRNKLRGKKKSSATTQQTGLVSAPDDHELSSLGIELIGHRVEVFWPEEKEFFEGVVTGYDAIKGTHTVGYVDGDEPDCFVLREQNVRWLSPKPVMHPADSADAPLVPRIGEDGYYEQCGVCGLDSTPDDALVICETCPMAVHAYRCAGLEAVPSGEWHCTKCADALQILAMEQAAYAAAQNAAEMAAKVGDTIWERDVRGRSRTILPEKISQGELMALGTGGALLPVEDDKWRGPDALDFIMMDFVERKSLGGYRIKVEINRNVVVGTVGEYTPKTASHVIYPDDPPAGSAPVQRAKLGKAKFEWIGPTYPGRPKQHQASATRKKLQALEATKANAAKRSAVAARAKTAQADKRKVGLVVVTEEEQAAKEAADVAEAAELGEHLQDIMTSGRPARKAALGVSATVMALKDEDASDDVGMARASKKRKRDITGGNAGETKKAKHKRKLQKRERDIAGGNAGETKEAKHKRKLQELQSRAQAAAKSLEEAARGFELARSGAEAVCGDAAASVDSAADYEPRYAYREVNLHAVDPKLLVGRPIKVYWAGNMEWFRAIVLSYNDEGKFHNIAYYETEEKEALNLCDPREDDGTDIRIRVLLSVGMDLKEPLPESLFQTNGGSVYNEHHGLVSDTDADAADDVGDPGNANGAAPAVPAPAPAAPAADAAAAGQGARETTILASGELAVIDEQVLSLADGCNDTDEPLPKLAQGALAATGNKTVQKTVQPEQLENQPKLQGVQFEVNPQHRGSPVLQQHASIDKQPEQLLPQEQQQGERRHKQQQEEQTKQQLEQEQQRQGGEEQQQDRQEGEQEKKQPSQAEQVQETGACGEKLASAPSEVSSGPPEGAVAPATKEEPAERMSMRPGDVVWARYSKGSAPHPAIVLMIDDKEDTNNENSKRRYAHPPAKLADCKYGNGGKPVAIQYFGTYEFMNAEPGWVIDFWSGVKSGLHLIAKKETYVVGIEQMVAYLESNTLQVEMGGEDYDEYLTFCDQDGYLEHITDDKEYLRAREERLALKVARAAAGADDDTETDADDFMPSSGKRHRSRKGAQTGKGGPDSPAPGRRSRAPGTPLSVKRRKPDELPLELGLLRVHALGRVVVAADDQAAWHTAKFIYPLGYRATRMYASQVAPTQQVEYSMEVRCSHPLDASYFINDVDDMDGIDDEHLDEEELEARRLRHTYREPVRQALPEGSAPVFVVKPPAGHGEETQGRTPTEAWKKVVDIIGATVAKLADKGTKEEMNVRAATQMRHDQAAKLFGFDHPKLCRLQQRLPGVMMLKNFMSWCDPAMKVKVRQAQKEAEKTKAEAKRWAKTAAPFKPLEYGFRAECCAVCYEDADTQENLLIQCSKCRILVHMDCVGVEKEPEGLWYCQLCQAQRPEFAPPAWCKLCPVAGGALVPTACSNWAHIACANWVPEVYMAPADSADKGAPGSTSEADSVVQIGKVPRARLALACEVCGVDHGAPIQCCIDRCFNAFHPLCARAAGYKLEVHVEDRRADDGDAPFGLTKNGNKRRFDRRRSKSGQGPEVQRNFVQRELLEGADIGNGAPAAIEMRAYCSKHTPVGERGEPVAGVWSAAPQIDEAERQILGPRPGTPCDDTRAGCSTDAGDIATVGRATPPLLLPMTTAAEATAKAAEDAAVAAKARENEDECARTRPFNWKLKRGFQEPEAVAGFLAKRSYLARVPFIQQGLERAMALESISGMPGKRPMPRALRDYMERAREAAGLGRALSQKDRYHTMMKTLPMRLAFGKSAIHGWGVFAKVPHAVGEFVIEYVGDLVRSAVADMRERQLYNEMVGTGTYIMKVNEEHVVDATRAGNIAHLMNHSCDANCASRIVTVDGVDHPVVFAKRPLAAGEELTYDYRFHSDDERLPCNCGAALCRGFVNFKLQPQELLDANEVARVPAAQVQLLDAAQSKEALDEHIKVLAASDKRIVMMAMETEAKQRAEADAKLQAEEAKAKRRAEEADQLARAAAESAAAAEPEAQAAAQAAVQASAQPTAQQLLSGECVHTPDALEHEQIPGAATYPVLQAPHAVTGEASLPQYAPPLARASPQYAEASLAQHGVPVDASGLPCVPLAGTPVLSGLSSGQAPPPLQARSPLLAEHAALARHQAVVVQQLLQGAPPAKSPPKQ